MVQIYEDDIFLRSMSRRMVEQFVKHLSKKFGMSLIGELTASLGLQVRETSSDIFVSQVKYAKNS